MRLPAATMLRNIASSMAMFLSTIGMLERRSEWLGLKAVDAGSGVGVETFRYVRRRMRCEEKWPLCGERG